MLIFILYIIYCGHYFFGSIEASYFDQINMTKSRLEFDRKKFTLPNLNVGA